MNPLGAISPADLKLYVGILFAAVLLALLGYIFFKTPVLTADQRKLLRFFCAFLAGCAGVFISGEALFKTDQDYGPVKIAAEGTAGFALFFAVWFTFEPLRRRSGGTAVAISFVENGDFAHAVASLEPSLKKVVNLDALTSEEKAAKMRAVHVEAKSPGDILAQLHEFVKPPAQVRPFHVVEDGAVLKLVPKG